MMRLAKQIIAAQILLGLAACTTPPATELRMFRESVAAIGQVGQPLLDDLALAERATHVAKLRKNAQANALRVELGQPPGAGPMWLGRSDGIGFVSSFSLDDAANETTLADPPGTAALRAGLNTVTALSAALVSLVDGSNAEAGTQDVVRSVGALTDLATAGASLVGTPLAGAGVKLAIEELSVLTRHLAEEINARRSREIILANEKQVGALLTGLRDAVPAMWGILTNDLQQQIARDGKKMSESELRALVARASGYRSLLSDYAALIARAQDGWRASVAASSKPSTLTLAALAENATRVRADLESIRRAQARLRSGRPAE
jgi:hypothetical protein